MIIHLQKHHLSDLKVIEEKRTPFYETILFERETRRTNHSRQGLTVNARKQDAEPFMTQAQRDRVREIAEWLATSDAGRALWHVHFGDPTAQYQPGAPGTVTPSRTISVAMESEDIDLYGDIDKLREKLKDFY